MEDTIVAKHYRLTKLLGKGAFGEIYQAEHLPTKRLVAIKFEDVAAKSPQLYLEAKIYLYLHSDNAIINESFAQVMQFGLHNEKNFMVMEMLGPSLEDLFTECGRKFSLKTVLMLAHQFLARIEFIHSKNIIHRDLKPDNFVIGAEKNAYKVFLIDFGLAKKFMNSKNEHIKYKDGKGLTGTARYASVNTHLGVEQTRRDDLEAMMYVLIYFLKGSLPWQNLKAKNQKEKYDRIKETKVVTKVEELCFGIPNEFALALRYVRELSFSQKPNYQYLRDLFKDLFKRNGYIQDYEYDWILAARQRIKQARAAEREAQIKNQASNKGTR